MRNHPLTPMTDANLVRVLRRQARQPVGLVDLATVSRGGAAIRERFVALRGQGHALAVVDAVCDADLMAIGAACDGMALVTGGSGMALGLPQNFRSRGLLAPHTVADALPATGGLRAVVAGSCSAATQKQVKAMRARHPSFRIDPAGLARGDDVVSEALDWASSLMAQQPVLIHATAAPEEVRQVQAELGAGKAGDLVEQALAAIACGLVRAGVGQLIVAGGETSGAVVKALRVRGLRIGPEIDPGVPWTCTVRDDGAPPLALALKSGNFGSEDFFLKAWERLP